MSEYEKPEERRFEDEREDSAILEFAQHTEATLCSRVIDDHHFDLMQRAQTVDSVLAMQSTSIFDERFRTWEYAQTYPFWKPGFVFGLV